MSLPSKEAGSLKFPESPSTEDDLIDSLQSQLIDERDRRKEERFVWLVVVVLMFDAFTFQDMQTWTGPIIIGVIQLLIIVVLGRRWQVDDIWTLTTNLIDKWDGKIGRG